MLAHEIIHPEMERDRQLVRLQILAVAQPLALETLQFLPHGQKRPLYVRVKTRTQKFPSKTICHTKPGAGE